MKITLIREERESGKEAVSTQETDMLMEKLKTENKTGYITELRSIIPHLKGTNARYEHIDRLPRLYPAVEMTRTKAGEHRKKTYNGLVARPPPPSGAPRRCPPRPGSDLFDRLLRSRAKPPARHLPLRSGLLV